uniref:FBA_2 domain-containing protein n=1 Tax=Panagrellus redivivus TaxID=6233 RepID=A0A7E4V944_PANRE
MHFDLRLLYDICLNISDLDDFSGNTLAILCDQPKFMKQSWVTVILIPIYGMRYCISHWLFIEFCVAEMYKI